MQQNTVQEMATWEFEEICPTGKNNMTEPNYHKQWYQDTRKWIWSTSWEAQFILVIHGYVLESSYEPELVSIEFLPLRKKIGLSSASLRLELSSADQYNTLFYIGFCLEIFSWVYLLIH